MSFFSYKNLVLKIIKNFGFLRVSFKYKENPFEYDNDKINDKINDKEKQILNVLMNNKNATIPEISFSTQISTATISRYLKQLQEKNIIERIGSNKSGYWKIIE